MEKNSHNIVSIFDILYEKQQKTTLLVLAPPINQRQKWELNLISFTLVLLLKLKTN